VRRLRHSFVPDQREFDRRTAAIDDQSVSSPSRLAAVRIRPASRDRKLAQPHRVERLVFEWRGSELEPTKYWLSTLPEDTPLELLVDMIKPRWRIECAFEELKSELGLAHFEGRGWRGVHHHASLCIAAYGFLILERSAFQ
jgi:SRSO17 transposase